MEQIGIIPYSPEWWHTRSGNFTGSEIYKLMSEPRGKSPFEKYEEHANLLKKWENQFEASLNKELKSMQNLKSKIETKQALVKELYEHKNDIHISDTAETYILEKVHEKLTGKPKMGVNNFATEWGIENEPLAKKWYSKITGSELEEPYMLSHDSIEGYSCTPDSFGSIKPLIEIKCPANGANHLKHWLISNDEYFKDKHDNYYWQCVSQMNIFKKKELDFVSFDPRIDNNRGMFIYSLNLDESDEAFMEGKIKESRVLFNEYFKLFNEN